MPADGPGRELLILGLGAWGAAVVDAFDVLHPQHARAVRRLTVLAVESETPQTAAAHQFTIVVPGAAAFQQYLAALGDGRGEEGRQLPRILPAALLADLRTHLAEIPQLDDRHRYRHGLLAAEPRIRRRLQDHVRRRPAALIVASASEPLVSAGLLLLGHWMRDVAAAEDGAPPLHCSVLLALDPVGPRAATEARRAARLHALLSELDRARAAGLAPGGVAGADPFAQVYLLGCGSLGTEDAAAAAAEAAGWWAAAVLQQVELARPLEPTQPASCRGRSRAYHAIVAGTASIDRSLVVRDQAAKLAAILARQLVGPRAGTPPPELRAQVERMTAEIRATLKVPGPADVARWMGDVITIADPNIHLRTRFEKVSEHLVAQAEAARKQGREFLFGGAIQRMSARIASGYLDQHVDWLWQIVARGHASIDDIVSSLMGVALALPVGPLEEAHRAVGRSIDDLQQKADRRRGEPASSRAMAQLNSELVKLATIQLRCEVPRDLLKELHETIARTVQLLLEAKGAVAQLERLAAAAPARGGTSPWRSLIPLQAGTMERLVLGAGAAAADWLAELAAGAPADAGRGLRRSPEALLESLNAFLGRRVEHVASEHPVASLAGMPTWLAGFVAALPPTLTISAAATPPAQLPREEAFLFADTRQPAELASAFPRPPLLLRADDAARVGWLRVSGPLALCCIDGLDVTRHALDTAWEEGRMLPLEGEAERRGTRGTTPRFYEPVVGDLAERLARAVSEDLRSPALVATLARLRRPGWADVGAAFRDLRALPRSMPALAQAAALGDWVAHGGLADLAGLERTVQDLERSREPDGSDTELVETCALAARVSTPVKKALEIGKGGGAVVYLTQALAAAVEAHRHAEQSLAGLERTALLQLLATWRGWIEQRITELKGRSELVVNLRTRRLVLAGRTTVVVEVENSGEHAALAARLQLLGSTLFRVVGADTQALPQLAPGDRRSVQFSLKPQKSGSLPLEFSLSWDDLESAGKHARHSEVVELIDEPPPFRKIARNPYIAGPPVRTPEMFFGRTDIFTYVRENLAGRFQDNILILHGQRRTGKSSILCQLERRDLLPEHVPVLLDLQGLGGFDTAGLLYQLARHASRRLARQLGDDAAPPLPERAAFEKGAYDAFQEHLDAVEDALEPVGKRVLFMIDEFDVLEGRVESGGVEREIFPFLRNLMQHRERVAFLLAGTQQLVEMRHDYWSILFSLASYRKVSYLSWDEARLLIEEPLKDEVMFDDLVIESLLHLTAGHPYYLQLTCQNLVQRLNHGATRAFVTPEDLHAVLPEVMAAGGGHFQHEWRTIGSPLARCVLAAMAENDATGLEWFASADIARHLAPAGVGGKLAPEAVTGALDQLLNRDVVQANNDRSAWRVRIDLLRHWVRHEHPLSRTVAEGLAS